jgi:hypothetical protein
VSRYKFDRSREFIPGYKFGGGHWCSVAVQIVSEPEISQGAGFKLRADARFDSRSFSEGWCPGATAITNLSWVQEHLPAGRQESKNRDKQLTFIVRVRFRAVFIIVKTKVF